MRALGERRVVNYGASMAHDPWPQITVTTPALQLYEASDDLLHQLAPLVHSGQAGVDPRPYDDPMSFYESDADLRVEKWRQAIRRGRVQLDSDSWRRYFVVVVDGEPVGMQDLVADRFTTHGTVATFSWLAADLRHPGLGREMRHAILQLAFDGTGAREATSSALLDNHGSNAISRALGYEADGTERQTRCGEPAPMQRWRLRREVWRRVRRDDIQLAGADAYAGGHPQAAGERSGQ